MTVQDLLYWVGERESIRKRKEAHELPPYTKDPILATYRFCNVRRRDDRVSQWLIKNVLTKENLDKAGLESFILFTALCRWVNWPPTIQAIMKAGFWPGKKLDWDGVALLMRDIGSSGGKVWTGAYMIKAAREWQGKSKVDFVISEPILGLCSQLIELREGFSSPRVQSKENSWRRLTSVLYWGSFMAGQVVDDWTWTPLLANAKDQFTWAPQGPGSLRGFNRIKGLPVNTRHSMEEWCAQLQDWRQVILSHMGKEYEDLTLHDVQNCLCELSKYLKTKNGEGRPRSKYRPEVAY